MIQIILCSVIISLFCLGLKISTGDGMLLNFIKVWLDKRFIKISVEWQDTGENTATASVEEPRIKKAYYPILYCIKCMPSIYGTAIALLLLPFTVHLIYQIPLVVFCSVTLNCIFYQMYE